MVSLHLSDINEKARKGVPEERGRRMTAELHTSGATRIIALVSWFPGIRIFRRHGH